jgi:heterodisulfide reductase subunit A
VVEAEGFVGNFRSIIKTGKRTNTIEHGAVIIATGAQQFRPSEYDFGRHPNIFLSLGLDQAVASDPTRFKDVKAAVFIQCVGSREPQRPYCSKVCCTHAIQSALRLKELVPEMDTYVLFRDIRTYGKREEIYREARVKGIVFIRYSLEEKPRVETREDKLRVTVVDQTLQMSVQIDADIVTLASAIVPYDNTPLSQLYKVSTNQEGFFLEAHMKLRPVDFATDGVFLAGLCHYPKPIEESIAQAKAAAARAATILVKEAIEMEPIVSIVDPEKCNGCGICERVCPYGAMRLVEIYGVTKAQSTPASCKGCGVCAASCPSKAVDMCHFSQHQIRAQVCAVG